jgi:hypothetical protein
MDATDITDDLTEEQFTAVTAADPLYEYGGKSYWTGVIDGHGPVVVITYPGPTEAYAGFADEREAGRYATWSAAVSMLSTEELNDHTVGYYDPARPPSRVGTRRDGERTYLVLQTGDDSFIEAYDTGDPAVWPRFLDLVNQAAAEVEAGDEPTAMAVIGAANMRYRAATAATARAQSRLGDLIRQAKHEGDIGRSGQVTVTDLAARLEVSREQITQVIASQQWRGNWSVDQATDSDARRRRS